MPKRKKGSRSPREAMGGPSTFLGAEDTLMALKGRPGPEKGLLYLGGPVDFADPEEHETRDWHHWPDWELTGLYPYCPRCECAGLTDAQIMEKNRKALMGAEIAVFDLRSHSIGTPIEMYMRLWRRGKPSILIGTSRSVFLRVSCDEYGGIMVEDPDAALRLVRGMKS